MLPISHFVIEGHRGVQSLYPENTLASFQAAIDLGLEFVELDLHFTKDEEIVIRHDFEIKDRLISSMTLSQVKEIDVGNTNPQFPLQKPVPGARIPNLSELFEMVTKSNHPNAKKLKFNLEIKSDPRDPKYIPPYEILSQKIVQTVAKYKLENRVYYSSFDPSALQAIKKIEKSSTLALIYIQGLGDDWVDPLIKICQGLGAQIVSPHKNLLNKKVMSAFKKVGLNVIPWTVNDLSDYEELVSIGVDGIISDYPQLFESL